MRIQNQTVVSLRYIMKNAAGEILEDNMKGDPVQYLHGAGTIFPSLESSLLGLKAGDKKCVNLLAAPGLLDEDFNFDVVIDGVREASGEEIKDGHPAKIKDTKCDADCDCHSATK